MPLTPERHRLNEVMEARRLQLRGDQGLSLTWVEVATRARISVESIHAIRRGQGDSIRARTQEALERGLQLPAGTIKRILEGGESDIGVAEVANEAPGDVLEDVTDEDIERLKAELQAEGVRLELLTQADLRRLATYAKGLADGRTTQRDDNDPNRRVS